MSAPDRDIKAGLLSPGQDIPLVIQPVSGQPALATWAKNERDYLARELLRHGALLLRGFQVGGVAGFERMVRSVSHQVMEYQDRAAPRTQVAGNVYTATDFPPEHRIFLHNESSFAQTWPSKIFFFCATPATQGGETPIADVRKVYDRIDASIRKRFLQKNVMYIRNFGDKLFGIPWRIAFQVDDENALEEYCRRAAIEVEWKGDDKLRTRQVRPAALKHPQSGEMVWFNHAAALHVTTLEPRTRAALQRMFQDDELPNNTYFGDGSSISDADLDVIRDAYRDETALFDWQQGDVLMLDNRLVAHGRHPYSGPREVVVAMADPVDWDEVETAP